MKKLFLVFVSTLFLSSCFISQNEKARSIMVRGTGIVSAKPDKVTIMISVITKDWIAKTASDTNAQIATKVQTALTEAGVATTDITTVDFSIDREESWVNGYQQIGKYRVRNTMKIVLHEIEKASTIVDTAIASGATELNSLTFSVEDNAALIREARIKAVKEAEENASLLAGASGAKIGKVLNIEEFSPSFRTMNTATDMIATEAKIATPVSAGSVEVSSSVTITYALK